MATRDLYNETPEGAMENENSDSKILENKCYEGMPIVSQKHNKKNSLQKKKTKLVNNNYDVYFDFNRN